MFSRDRPDLSPAQQFLFLCANPLCAGKGQLRATGLVWDYSARPSPLSREYSMRITFEREKAPRVFVLDPDLSALAGGRPLPHVYRDPLRLCLTLPGTREWTGTMRIDQTFVPWATLWLYYFEDWLITDEWKGGGEHPDSNDNDHFTRRVRRAVR